jgi:TolB-like protein/cytochrome c-type biogenesis protein CcmH/NrfG
MAFESAQKAIEIDDTLDYARALLSAVYLVKRQHEKAVAEAERAVALNPNGALMYNTLAGVVGCSGRWEESIIYGKKSIRLNPFPPLTSFHWLGRAYFMTGQYDEAILTVKKLLDVNPNYLPAHAFLAATYSSLGLETEGAAAAKEVLRINPKFSLESYAKTLPYKNKADIERYIAALRKTGMPDKPSLPLPDKPSIAVLAFDNMSADPKQVYLADGISENLISSLSKISKLFVIARNSTFTYKGKPVRVQQIGRELGVRYVLEGSVQRAGDRLRVTAQLIDATTGNHLWSERYDRDLKNIFAVQDDITKNIIMAMQVKLTEGEQARAAAKGTNNLEAYLKYLQANEYYHRGNMESNALAKQLAGEAIALDPEYAMAYGVLAKTRIVDFWLDTSKSQEQSLAEATELLQKAIVLDDTYAEAYGILGSVFSMRRQPDEALTQAKKAVALNPNSAELHYRLAKVLVFDEKDEEAIPEYKIAIRLNPIPPTKYLWSLGIAYAETRQYDEAITWCKKAVRQAPDNLWARIMMTTVYSWSGRDEEARAEAAEVLRIQPKFSLERFAKRADPKLVSALRKAGLK